MCRAIGRAGQHLITPGSGVLTHCNAGALAVSELGTATAPMYLAHAAGVAFRVYTQAKRGRCCRAAVSPRGSCSRPAST